jgi:hypothetical protein
LAGKKQLEFPLNTTTTTMTIPSDLSNADIVVIGFGGTAPAKVCIMLPACCFLCLFFSLYYVFQSDGIPRLHSFSVWCMSMCLCWRWTLFSINPRRYTFWFDYVMMIFVPLSLFTPLTSSLIFTCLHTNENIAAHTPGPSSTRQSQ